jgi:predicted dehydrogenase
MPKMKNATITRRTFLGTVGAAAVAGSGLAVSLPKVRLAAIGTGGRGHTDLHNFLRSGLCEISCACDVYEPALAWVRKEQPQAKIYKDYRVMLRECAGQYDAVSIMTPDHTHAVAFFEASKYNVPVYCAKPLGHTISETLAMMRVAREKKLITHVSHHGNSEPGTPLLREWMESGVFGQAMEAHVYCNYGEHLFREPNALLSEPAEPPKGFDWELWQGPAKRRAYIKNVYSRRWRSWSMYGEGCVGDWCCHLMGPISYALDLDLPCAVTLAEAPEFDLKSTPCSFPFAPHYVFEYPAKGKRAAFTLHWYDGDARAPRPPGLEPDQPFDPVGDGLAGGWLRCEKETLVFGQTGASGLRVVPHSRMKAVKPHLPPKKYPRYKNHWAEFLQAVQQKRAANTPFEQCGKYTIMGLMGTVATRFPGRRLEFDPASMRFTNVPEANALLRPEWTDAALSEWGSYL